MRTTAEQRAAIQRALADEAYADLNRDEVRVVLALLDDLDEALAERDARIAALEAARREVEALRALHVTSVREAELLAERDRLRVLCREAATAATAVPITASYSCRGCGALGSRECEIGCWVPRLGQMIRRLNEAGGEP